MDRVRDIFIPEEWTRLHRIGLYDKVEYHYLALQRPEGLQQDPSFAESDVRILFLFNVVSRLCAKMNFSKY